MRSKVEIYLTGGQTIKFKAKKITYEVDTNSGKLLEVEWSGANADVRLTLDNVTAVVVR